MPQATGQGITVAEVEREIASGMRWLAFAPSIEAAFDRESRAERVGLFCVTGIAAVVLYDLFLLADWVTLHDMFACMVIARLGIFTPVIAMSVYLVRRRPAAAALEFLGVFGAVLAVLLPMTALVFSESTYRLSYQYGTVLVMLFATVVQRLRFRYALGGLAAMLTIQLVTTHASGAFDIETFIPIVLFFASAAILLVIAAYFLERAERRGFLFALHGALLRDQIAAAARTDPLTGLFNRRHLADATREIWTEAGRRPGIVSAILLDIDHFKPFNDSCGHLEGDACLRTVSDRITAIACPATAPVFRFGGEEILVLLPGVDPSDAIVTAEAMRVAIEAAAIPHPAVGGVVTASLGVASVRAPETSVGELIAAADTALYAAKRAGRNRVLPASARSGSPPIEATRADAAAAA